MEINCNCDPETLRIILSKLKKVKGPDRQGNYSSLCPFHDDKHNSLSLHPQKGIQCFSPNCRAYGGIRFAELANELGVPIPQKEVRSNRKIEATYNYLNASGELLYQVVRFVGKEFAQRRPDGAGGWIWNMRDVERVLYRLPELINSPPDAWIFLAEGEKDADRLASIGLIATTNPGGAGKWRTEFNEALRGRRIAILRDNDPQGQQHAYQVAEALMNIAAVVRIPNLPNLTPKGDISDWLDEGGTVEDLLHLVETTPVYTKSSSVGFVFTPLSTLLSEPEENVPWLWDKTLPAGGLSILVAKPKVGKSTFARNLAKAVASGEQFLGRETAQGPVLYLALEEKRQEVARHFKRMGSSQNQIYVHTGSAPEEALEQLRERINTIGAKLAIVDPLLRMLRLKDSNDYAEVTTKLEPILIMARETGCHLLTIHHANKMEREGGDIILGSTALYGSVDTAILIRRRQNIRTVETSQRYGEDIPPTVLSWDADQGIVMLGGTVEEMELTHTIEAVLEALSEDKLTEKDLREAVGGNTGLVGKALRRMRADGLVNCEGGGKRGDPYRYSNMNLVSSLANIDKRDKREKQVNYSVSVPDVMEV